MIFPIAIANIMYILRLHNKGKINQNKPKETNTIRRNETKQFNYFQCQLYYVFTKANFCINAII